MPNDTVRVNDKPKRGITKGHHPTHSSTKHKVISIRGNGYLIDIMEKKSFIIVTNCCLLNDFYFKKKIRKYTSEMAGESNNDKYMIRNKCECKYTNDEEHISTDFGYTRLKERYTTCKCMARKNTVIISTTITIKKN